MMITNFARYLRLAAALAAISLASGCATLYWNEEVDRPHARKFEARSAINLAHLTGNVEAFRSGGTTWFRLNDDCYIEDLGASRPLRLTRSRGAGSSHAGWALLRDLPKRNFPGLSLSVDTCNDRIDLHRRHEAGPEWLDTCRAPCDYLADLYLLHDATAEMNAEVSYRGADGMSPPRPLENSLAGPRDYLTSGAIKSGYLLSAALDVATFPIALPAYLWLRGMAKGYQH